MTPQLSRRLEVLRNDFARVTGKPFKHFYCPILLEDLPGELCEGHIVPENFGNLWVPQRKDVDNFYGSAAEADVVGLMDNREMDIKTSWHTPSIQKQFRPRIEVNGKPIEHYLPKAPKELSPVPGHTPAEFVGEDGKKVRDVVFKLPTHEVAALVDKDVQLVVEKNFIPVVVASVLKAAHLTMFDMLGYDYVLSPTGNYLADILKQFFLNNKDDSTRGGKRAAADEYFASHSPMVFPMQGDAAKIFGGTVNDKHGIMCCGMSDRPFAIGVVVKMQEVFCALVPPDNAEAIGTYVGFLKDPPPSIAIRDFFFCPADRDKGSRWELTKDTYRVELPRADD